MDRRTSTTKSAALGTAEHQPVETPDAMVRIPGGSFVMGSDRHYPEEAPAHPVTQHVLNFGEILGHARTNVAAAREHEVHHDDPVLDQVVIEPKLLVVLVNQDDIGKVLPELVCGIGLKIGVGIGCFVPPIPSDTELRQNRDQDEG